MPRAGSFSVRSLIDIEDLAQKNSEVLERCHAYEVDPTTIAQPSRMTREVESDWDGKEVLEKYDCLGGGAGWK